jgi:hypothetical protein
LLILIGLVIDLVVGLVIGLAISLVIGSAIGLAITFVWWLVWCQGFCPPIGSSGQDYFLCDSLIQICIRLSSLQNLIKPFMFHPSHPIGSY